MSTSRLSPSGALISERIQPAMTGRIEQGTASFASSLPEVGPAYEVALSDEAKEISRVEEPAERQAVAAEKQEQLTQKSQRDKAQQNWRVQSEVARLKTTEQRIRAHETAHMSAGGAFAGGVTYVYSKGPDGKMYITGGEVPIQAPEGKTPEETIKNMEVVRRAALAPADPSAQDLAVAAAAMQIESRARAAIRSGRYLKQSDMDENTSGPLNRPPVWPTSMAGLIATLMPPEGSLGRRIDL